MIYYGDIMSYTAFVCTISLFTGIAIGIIIFFVAGLLTGVIA